jgi:hypothetical protein
VCVPDGSPEPPDDARHYVPSARPGHRAPHVWLSKDCSILDTLGPDFTLLSFGSLEASQGWEQCASSLGVPLTVVNIDNALARQLYDCELVLIRPDMMVAWRGDAGQSPKRILERASGRHLE